MDAMDIRDVEASVVSIEILNERSASVPEVMEKMSVFVERAGVIINRVCLACNEVMVCTVRLRSPMTRDSPVIFPGYRPMTVADGRMVSALDIVRQGLSDHPHESKSAPYSAHTYISSIGTL